MKLTWPKILHFIDGPVPTADDNQMLQSHGPGVVFRNAVHVPKKGEGAIEPCDGVSGKVPDTYKHLPSGDDAIEAYKNRMYWPKLNANDAVKVDSADDKAPAGQNDQKLAQPLPKGDDDNGQRIAPKLTARDVKAARGSATSDVKGIVDMGQAAPLKTGWGKPAN